MILMVNGEERAVADNPGMPLLWVLHDELGLTGTKFGCGVGICGTCTVLVDGEPIRSCVTVTDKVDSKSIQTIEGLAKTTADGQVNLHPVQQAFLETQAPQCSWCMSGQILTAVAYLENNPSPTAEEIVTAMSRNYCRCGCYVRIREAVVRAVELMAEEEQG